MPSKHSAAPAGDDGKPDGDGDEPKIGETVNVSGETVSQVGKHPDLPADVPVQAGTALDPALPAPPAKQAE